MTLVERSEVLGGEGKTVQIDESKIGKRKYHCGHMVDGQWVLGGIQEEFHRYSGGQKRRDFASFHSEVD